MKTITSIFSILIATVCFGQNNTNIGGSSPNTWLNSGGGLKNDSMFRHALAADSASRYSTEAATRYFTATHSLWYKNNIAWTEQLSKLKSQAIITSTPTVGDTATTAADFVGLFFKSQAPTATLTGGTTLEFTASPTVSATLNWSASRQFATQPLASIVVAGVTQSFSQPSAPGTVSGTQAVAIPANVNITYSNVVTTVDNKQVIVTTSFPFQFQIYAGFVTSATPTSADIIAATGSSYVGGKFSATRNQSGSLSTPSSSKYIIFCNPVSYGVPNIIINGLGIAYSVSTITFVNSLGYSSSYYLAVSPFPTAGNIDTYVVN